VEIVATTTRTSDDGLLAVDVLPLVRVADGLALLTLDLSAEEARRAAVFPDVGDVDSIVVQVGDAADADSCLTDIPVS
jgi:hypothetical protein